MNWLTKQRFNLIDLVAASTSVCYLGRGDYVAFVLTIFLGVLISVLASWYTSARKSTASSVQ